MRHDEMQATGEPPTTPEVAPPRLSYEERAYEMAGIGPRRRAFSSAITRGLTGGAEWLQEHWLGVVNGFLGTYIGLAVATPVLYMAGFDAPAEAIFRTYRFFCDELPTHSLFLGGYQICLCSRCLAIYSTMLIVGLTLSFLRRRGELRPLHWWLWVLAALPMALDGFTQLFGLRESTLALRVITGALFGLGTALFVLPQMDAAARLEPRPSPSPSPGSLPTSRT
jgi:uncharacterized membrane protein